MKIAIGCDEAALTMKNAVKEHLEKKGIEVTDMGAYDTNPSLYPDTAVKVCTEITEGRCERGMLFCGTGIGMAMTANKVPGIRAAVCHDPFSTERSIKSNDAQVLCMGARVIAPQLALYLIDIWLTCRFDGGPSQEKVERMSYYEARFSKNA